MVSILELHEYEKGAWYILSAVGQMDTVTTPEGEKAALAAHAK